jgi:hypothetical protein
MKHPATTSSSHAGTVVLMLLLVLCLFLIAEDSFGADVESTPDDGKIEVVYPVDRLVPYRERRTEWAATFSIQVEQIYPDKYVSQADGYSYQDFFGESTLNITQGQVGAKYNFGLGSVGASLLLGAGSVQDGRIANVIGVEGTDTELQVTKMGGSFNFTMDALFEEPYLAPYVEFQVFKIDWLETAKGFESIEGSTQVSTGLSAGVLIQLNWLDPATAFEAQNTSGLQNTYLDIFVSQYNGSSSDSDPNFQTDVNYGAGLKFEF